METYRDNQNIHIAVRFFNFLKKLMGNVKRYYNIYKNYKAIIKNYQQQK